MWIFIKFPSGCCFALLRPDAVPFWFLKRSWELFLMFLKPLRVLLGLLGTLLGASWSLLGRSWAVLGRNWVVLGRLLVHFCIYIFFGAILGATRVHKGSHFGSQNGSEIDKKEVQIQERKSHLLESSWCDFGSSSKASWCQTHWVVLWFSWT